MATIPSGSKLVFVDSAVPTRELKSSRSNSKTEVYTIDDIAETVGGGLPYKVYSALLTQTGTNAPVATVLENTLGGEVVWTRDDVGRYTGTLIGAFTAGKYVQPPQAALGSDQYVHDGGNTALPATTNNSRMFYWRNDDDSILVFTVESGAYVDGQLLNTAIDIKVYI